MEMGGQARAEEMLRACTTAPTEAGGIIGDNEDLNIHGDLSEEGERRPTGPLQLRAISPAVPNSTFRNAPADRCAAAEPGHRKRPSAASVGQAAPVSATAGGPTRWPRCHPPPESALAEPEGDH
jgi:hypothetical protein